MVTILHGPDPASAILAKWRTRLDVVRRFGNFRLPYLVYDRISLPEAVNGTGNELACYAWRTFELHYCEVSLVRAIARLLVLVLVYQVVVARVLCRRARVLHDSGCSDGAIQVEVQVARLVETCPAQDQRFIEE